METLSMGDKEYNPPIMSLLDMSMGLGAKMSTVDGNTCPRVTLKISQNYVIGKHTWETRTAPGGHKTSWWEGEVILAIALLTKLKRNT